MHLLNSNDQLFLAKEYAPLIIAYRNGAPVRLSDVATVIDSQENIRNAGLMNGKPAVIPDLFRQPQANIIETADRVLALLPMYGSLSRLGQRRKNPASPGRPPSGK